ncbi:hypothetical protein [Dyella terrae]|uniref:hypothetical protein n=1 Tax=Dyella terrae TaxID=522259 RepID=UPI001EFC4A0D|nr:hypothetical protein [Dyella terrae]ULU24400.1 hypothetical protein DYST_01316 [Dyella terrae]
MRLDMMGRWGGKTGRTNRWHAVASSLVLVASLVAWPAAWAVEPQPPAAAAPLQFRITEGNIENAFFQQGDVAAHLLLNSGAKPRVLVAFPAGNSGAGIWFEPTIAPVRWTLDSVTGQSHTVDGHAWHGIVARATVTGDTLVIKDAVLGSIRVLRDYQLRAGLCPAGGYYAADRGEARAGRAFRALAASAGGRCAGIRHRVDRR